MVNLVLKTQIPQMKIPGFEVAIVLRSKSDVFIADIDGADDCSDVKETYSLSSHHQKSIAGIESCNDPDYFYDFYAPLSDLTTYFGITASSSLRMVSITNTSNSCALEGSVSDIGGVDDSKYGGCFACAWEDLVNSQVPTSLEDLCDTCSGFEPIRTDCPTIRFTSGYRLHCNFRWCRAWVNCLSSDSLL